MRNHLLIILYFFLTTLAASAQSPIGIWKTIDDATGEAKSHVEIFEQNEELHGKIIKLLSEPEDRKCDSCPGDKRDQPLIGMEIMWGLEADKDEWSGGKIMDPENGKTYKCKIWFENNKADELYLRGYIGFSLLGRNQVWVRIE